MKISIIIPIYNGEKYLDKIIPKILNQNYKDIELILVNDGSTDSSEDICEKYKKLDNRVVLINKKNGGICSARNTGLETSTGEWISFIDQDDDIRENIYEVFYSGVTNDVDMIVGGKRMNLIDSNNSILKNSDYIYNYGLVKDKDFIIKLLFNVNQDKCLFHLWNCLYKRKIIVNNNICFNKNLKYGHEDTLFNIEYCSKCNSINFLPIVVYEYFRRYNESTSLKKNKNYLKDYIELISCTKNALNQYLSINNKLNKMFYTYILRSGLSLYKMYSLDEKYNNQKEKIKEIFSIVKSNTTYRNVQFYSVNNYIYYLYLKIINFLLKINQYGTVVKILNFKRK